MLVWGVLSLAEALPTLLKPELPYPDIPGHTLCGSGASASDLQADMEVLVCHLHAVDVLDGVQRSLRTGHVDKPHPPALAGVLLLQHFHTEDRPVGSKPAD